MKKHHTLVVVGLVLSLLGPLVAAGLHLAGGSLVVTGLIEWWYSRNTETYRMP